MVLATKQYVDHLIDLHGPDDVRGCTAIQIKPDGYAEIDERSPAWLDLLKKWSQPRVDPPAPQTAAQRLLQMARGQIRPSADAKPRQSIPTPTAFDPAIWGPRVWAMLYEFAIGYDGDKDAARKYLWARASDVACGECRTHYQAALSGLTLADLADRDSFFAWLSELQNKVNRRRGVPELPLDVARVRWGMDEPPSPPVDYFGMAVVISLKRTPERLAQFWRDWPIDWPFLPPEVFEAIDGETEQAKPGWRGGAGAWGLMRSCLAVLDRYLATPTEKPLLIFEDDCEWIGDAMPSLTQFIARLPADFDAAFPGAQHLGPTVPAAKSIVRAFGAHRMHCIIIARKYAQALRDGWAAFDFIQDHWLTAESPRRRFYAAETFLCGQRANVSSLMGHHVPDRAGNEWTGTGSGFSRPADDPGRFAKLHPLRCGGMKRHIDVGERDAFNGTAIDTPHGQLLVFRGNSLGTIKYRWLDSPSVAQLPLRCNDDPRLVWHLSKLYLSTNFWWGSWAGGQMELREVTIGADRKLALRDVGKFTRIQGWPEYQKPAHEKNWAPFSHERGLFYVYSINPHRILSVDLQSGTVKRIHESMVAPLPWSIMDGSELRCSAPPVLMAGEFLSTFHVRREKDYYTGFYTFDPETFRITRMSREPVLWPEDSDGVCWRNGNMRLLFIQGMDVIGDTIRLWGGDNDHSVMVADIPLPAAMDSLQTV